jgi:hypothetical protein
VADIVKEIPKQVQILPLSKFKEKVGKRRIEKWKYMML